MFDPSVCSQETALSHESMIIVFFSIVSLAIWSSIFMPFQRFRNIARDRTHHMIRCQSMFECYVWLLWRFYIKKVYSKMFRNLEKLKETITIETNDLRKD